MKFIKGLMPGKRLEADPEFEEEAEDEVLESEFDRILQQKQQSADGDDWDDEWDETDDDWDDEDDEDDFAAEAPAEPVRPRRPSITGTTANTGSGEVDLAALNNLLNTDDAAPSAAAQDDFDLDDDEDGWDDLNFDEDDFDNDPADAAPPAPAKGSGRKIWDLEGVEDDDEDDFDDDFDDDDDLDDDPRPAAKVVDVSAAAAAQPPRAAGRVKTRLLGFQPAGVNPDVFGDTASSNANGPAMFPVGWIVVISGPGRGACFTLMSGVSQIGRGDDMTIKLDFGDTSISRQNHAAVAFDEELNQFFLGHGGKSNLVRLNDKPVLSTEALSDGDLVRIGETTLRFVALCGNGFTWQEDEGDDLNYAAAT